MTRENSQANNMKPTKLANNTNSTNNQSQQQHKVVYFEPFQLFSNEDKSLKKALKLVENASLNKQRVCVVSIVSKSPLDDTAKNVLVQSLINTDVNSKRRHRYKLQEPKITSSKSTVIEQSPENQPQEDSLPDLCCKIDMNYENQVTGHIDTRAGIIVLNLTSFMDSDKFHSLSQSETKLLEPSAVGSQSFLSSSWSHWNQNLLKTMLILFTMSHIVIFYNPELSIDYSLIQTFKIIESLRLKSQNRIIDLLETIASKQIFSQYWIRQGRVACPRALFVCDITSFNMNINQNEIIGIKRELEDQIYKLLKKASITVRPYTSNNTQQGTLFALPERDDFVFILAKKQQQMVSSTSSRPKDSNLLEENAYQEFYSSMFKSLKIRTHESVETESESLGHEKNKTSLTYDENEKFTMDDAAESSLVENIPPLGSISSGKESASSSKHNKFKAFVNWHISEFQAVAQIDQDNKQQLRNSFLPRYDDFFTVMIHLKNLLFYSTTKQEDQNSPTATVASSAETLIWSTPDERRFIDVYDLIDHDQLFSKRHCHRTRLAAFDFYIRGICKPLSRTNHENSLEAAKQLYLNHARGTDCMHNLDLLLEQCNSHWINLNQPKPVVTVDTKEGRSKGQQKSKGIYIENLNTHAKLNGAETRICNKSNPTIIRRANGIKMATSCDCGRQNNYMILPVDRKKRLERIDVHLLNE